MSRIETFHRGKPLGSESKMMPAATYNQMLTLFHQSGKPCIFVPIRNMQYMAIIDDEEIIFVDSARKALVEFSWQKFHPQSRNTLTDPVPYEFVYYDTRALETIKRAHGEFAKCIYRITKRELEARVSKPTDDTIIPFHLNNKD